MHCDLTGAALLSLVAIVDGQVVLVLDQEKMQGVSGLAKYRHEFSTVTP